MGRPIAPRPSLVREAWCRTAASSTAAIDGDKRVCLPSGERRTVSTPNRFGLPPFYTLHVWAWKKNPTGTFVNWHANVSCDNFGGQ
jgi:hypothetical protein